MGNGNRGQKILLIAPSWIGDMVMAQALCKLLKLHNQNAIIDVLATEHLQPLIARMPEIHQIIPVQFKHGSLDFWQRYKIGKNLRSHNYDQAIILPNSFKSALIPYFAKIPLRTGWRGEMRYGLINDIRILDKTKLPLMVERFLALGYEPKQSIQLTKNLYPQFQIDSINVAKTLQKINLRKPENNVLALCIGAEYGSAKRWPAKYFAEVAQTKINEGWHVWLFGSAKDKPIAEKIVNIIQIQNLASLQDLTGKTDLGEAIDLLSLAKVVISNDSGLMHIAAALDLPLIAIYGSSTPQFTPPLTEKARIVSLNLKCSPCFRRECKFLHLKCLTDLRPQKILEVLNSLNL